MKINNLRGDVTDISARTEALVGTICALVTFLIINVQDVKHPERIWFHRENKITGLQAVLPFQPKYRLGHPENCLF